MRTEQESRFQAPEVKKSSVLVTGWQPHTPAYLEQTHWKRHRFLPEIRLALVCEAAITAVVLLCAPSVWTFIFFALLCAISNVFFWRFMSRLARDVDLQLLSNPDHPGELLVEMWVENDGVVTGTDRGVVWFDREGYYFLGHRSWFRIAGQDLVAWTRKAGTGFSRELDAFPEIKVMGVKARNANVRLGLRLLPTDLAIGGPVTTYDRLAAQIHSFRNQWQPGDLPTQLPPLEVDSTFHGVNQSITVRQHWMMYFALFLGVNLWHAQSHSNHLARYLVAASCLGASAIYIPKLVIVGRASLRRFLLRRVLRSGQNHTSPRQGIESNPPGLPK